MVPPLARSVQITQQRVSPQSTSPLVLKNEDDTLHLPMQNNDISTSLDDGKSRRGIGRGGWGLHVVRSIAEKPRWLQAIYLLFLIVCLNAVLTYNRQKRLVRMTAGDGDKSEESLDLHYSAGAEEHVVSQSYGSSMYGGGIHTTRQKSKSKAASSSTSASKKFQDIRPPPDGTKDLNLKLDKKHGGSKSDFGGFSIYVMSDTPVSNKSRGKKPPLDHHSTATTAKRGGWKGCWKGCSGKVPA